MGVDRIRRNEPQVANRRHAVPAIVVLAALALASCKLDLFTFSPAITLSAQSLYTSAQISVGYNIPSDGNLFSSGSSTVTRTTLEKRIAGIYLPIERYQSQNSGSGNLYFDLSQILTNSGQGFSSYVPVDGTYRISMQVVSGGKAVPGYSGEQTFAVDTSGGNPTITEVSPGMISSTAGGVTIPVVIKGNHLNVVTSLGVTNSTSLSFSIKSSSEIDTSVTLSTLPAPPAFVTFTVTNNAGVGSTFNVEIGALPSITSLVPASATGADNTDQIVVLNGGYFSPFSKVTMTDSKGNAVPLFANILQGQVTTGGAPTYPIITTGGTIPIYANLSGAATGPATITVTNPDGLSTSAPFTIN